MEKFVIGQDITKYVVNMDSIIFLYHLGRQVLYSNSKYTRFKAGPDKDNWIAIDQVTIPKMIKMMVQFGNLELPCFEVGKLWLVSHIWHKIAILLNRRHVLDEYNIFVQ